MAVEIIIPSPGESITEVQLGQWIKSDGDWVEKDEQIGEIGSEKATLPLNASVAGILEILAKEGDTLTVGDRVASIEESEQAPDSKGVEENSDTKKQVKPRESKIISIKVPSPGESISEVQISSWSKKPGDWVEKDEQIGEIESEKATLPLVAEEQGILKILVQVGDTVQVNSVVCQIEVKEQTPGSKARDKNTESSSPSQEQTSSENYASGHPSVAAQKILQEKGITIKEIQGSGKDGRITKQDVANSSLKKLVSKPVETFPTVSVTPGEKTERKQMSPLRKKIASRLVAVKNETAMLTTFNEVDLLQIKNVRAKYKKTFKETHQIGIGFMSFFTKAITMALKTFPNVNSMIDGDKIVSHDYVNMGIAVSSPNGLMVPVLRNTQLMTLAAIEKEIKNLALKARDSKLTIDEMSGGTFTITNGGVFGSMMSTPIINPPQSAILGMHNIIDRPIAIQGKVVIRPMMYLAMSYDHRIIDGRESVSFLVKVKQLLEDPIRMLLEV